MAFRKETKIKSNFSKISIGLASPEEILENSSGEVLKPETINYRTYKPERDGLFCERIFGPVKDYECHCGKYKRIRYKGIVCDRCGVEVTEKKVRRERMGHIQLVVPVAHIWYFRSLPNKIGYLLGLPTKKLDSIIYYERYVVIQPGAAAEEGVNEYDLLSEEEYLDLLEKLPRENQYLEDTDPNKFIAKMGAEAIYDLLAKLDLDALSYELRHKASNDSSQQRKNEALKRLQVVESFRASRGRNKPEWMIVRIVPVIPPELRPLVPLDGGRFATSDLNDLYRRVIIRNNRLKRLIEIKAPEVILRNEKRMLQEAVDSLFDNSRKSSAVKTDANRPLKSLSDSLKGKQGRFRQNLLGKRVDYSARSVIVVGPELKMGECGIPKLMAAELYKPLIIRKLIERGIVKTVKSAKKIVDRKEPVIWDILEHVMKGHPVLLNRAPTLHRLGIQAFQPHMIEGKAIQLHPLACTAFNADFDGDQMAVHLPLSNEAILEAQMLMLQAHNILNPANGAPITVPAQDMVLGLYYITKLRKGAKGEGLTFYGPEEALIAYNEGKVDIHAIINVVVKDLDKDGNIVDVMMKETSVGRVIVNEIVPAEVGYLNTIISKKSLRDIISDVIKAVGVARACEFLDGIKNLGYHMAFKGGLSFNLGDIIIPKEKEELVNRGNDEVIATLYERILGRVSVHDIIHPTTGKLIVAGGEEITEDIAQEIEDSPIESVEIRSVLTCESKKGVCAKCYGRNLASSRMVQKGEAVGVIAAQSIGEPGTQLTLRTFHAGGIAGNMAANASIVAKNNARLEFEELRTVDTVDETTGEAVKVVVGRLAEVRFIDVNTGIILSTHNVPYGSKLYAADGDVVEKGKLIAKWDPFNAVIITEATGKIEFESMVENVTYKVESDEATGLREIIIIESKDKTKVPSAHITTEDGNLIRTYNFPVGGHVVIENNQSVKAGDILVKIPRAVGKAGDITGGLPRVTELFEARNPSNPAVVSEIDGEVTMGKIKRGNREIIVTSKTGEVKKYLVNLSKQILVQENDYVRAGTPLSDGAITPADILAIKGPTAVQEYIVNEVQDVYRLQGVKIIDKHFEIIVRQMMRKVEIDEPGDTRFLEQQVVDKQDFMEENDRIWGKKVVVDAGDSQNLQPGQIVTARKLRDESSMLKRRDLKPVEVRDAIPATSTQILQGITRAALGTSSFMSAASFQETTKVLNEAAINGKVDRLEGMKENVICGHLIPAGTGQREFEKIVVGSKEEYDRILANRKNVLDYSEVE